MREEVNERSRQDLVDRVLRWRVATIGAIVAAIPGTILGHWLGGRMGETIAAVGCIVAALVAWTILLNIQCPKCKDQLFNAWHLGGRNPFASRCASCGLSLLMDSPSSATPGSTVGKDNGAA